MIGGSLQATCSHVRLLAVVGRNDRAAEDTAMELVSVLQVGVSTFPLSFFVLVPPPPPPPFLYVYFFTRSSIFF